MNRPPLSYQPNVPYNPHQQPTQQNFPRPPTQLQRPPMSQPMPGISKPPQMNPTMAPLPPRPLSNGLLAQNGSSLGPSLNSHAPPINSNVTKQMGNMQINQQQPPSTSAFSPYRPSGPPMNMSQTSQQRIQQPSIISSHGPPHSAPLSGPPSFPAPGQSGPPSFPAPGQSGPPMFNAPPSSFGRTAAGPPRSSLPPQNSGGPPNQHRLTAPPTSTIPPANTSLYSQNMGVTKQPPPTFMQPSSGNLSGPLSGPSLAQPLQMSQQMGQHPRQMGQHPQRMGQHPQQMGQHPQQMGQHPQQMGQPPQMSGPPRHMTGPPQAGQPMQRGPMSHQPQPMGGQMSGPMGGPQQGKRIDPNQMPNPIQVMRDDQNTFENEVFSTSMRGKVPPLVSTKCRIQDDGNCSPRYMRSSVYSIPCNQDMLKDSSIPMAIVTTPMAKIPQDERPINYVMHGASGPFRCNRCKAYMNPFMQFIDGGRRFVCNICSHSSEVPQEYFCHLDHQGRRVDTYERPELCFGSYEFIATEDYCKNGKLPSPPAFIFMIDVSYQSVQQGMVRILTEELHTLLDDLPMDVGMEESLIKVGFVTYSNQLHFYNVKGDLPQPQMMVVTDINDAFVPLQDGFLVEYKNAKAVVDSLLDMIPEMFKESRETEVILGPVIKSGIEALKGAGISGKLFIFHSTLPIAEAPGKLKNREDRKLLATDKEKNILMPQGTYYMNLVKECVDNGVSIDLFLFPNGYIDVATIGLMVTQTGGQVYRYSYFKESTHGKQFICDLRKNFKREIGFDAIMRLRCSTGLRPVEFYGSFVMNNTTDVELASIDSDKAIAIELKHDDKIPEDGVAFVQNALLYTSVSGQRRLRIHNMSFSTCSQLAELYRCCELDTTVNFLSKYALRQVLTSTPQVIKDSLVQRCVQVLACYRQYCATPSTAGQLILPECMKLLPLYINCLTKSDVLAGGSEMSSDDRAFLMQACLSMSPTSSSSYLYPRVIALHSLDLEHEDDLIPGQTRCLGEKFEDGGIYLLENTISMFIWVGLQANPKHLQELFGANSIGQLDVDMTQLPAISTALSKRVREIIEEIQSERQRYLKLTVVRQRDKLEPWFKHYIVEDAGFHSSHLSYVDFLCHVHKEIRNILN